MISGYSSNSLDILSKGVKTILVCETFEILENVRESMRYSSNWKIQISLDFKKLYNEQ